MNENQYIKPVKKSTIIICVISWLIFVVSFLVYTLKFEPDVSKAIRDIYVILNICVMLFSSIIAVITSVDIFSTKQNNRIAKHFHEQALLWQQCLTKNFSEVTLRDKSLLMHILKNESIKCKAKLNDNNEIIYKIEIDVESTTNDPIEFFQDFKINN